MLFDVASSMFRCHTGPITGNGVPTTQAKPPSGIIYVYLFPERSNHFSLAIFKCLHIFYSLTIYIYIYYSISLLSLSSKFPRIRRRRRILMEERGIVAHFRCNGSQHREQFEPIAVSKLIRERDTISSFATKT